MRRYRAKYTPEASARIGHLHPEVKRSLWDSIRLILENPLVGYSLCFELSGLMSFRAGRYRIIYRIDESEPIVQILYAGPRRDIYEEFRDLLLRRVKGD